LSRIVWAITGSGSFLRELAELFIKFRSVCSDLEVAVALSCAGKEVSRIYGVLDKLQYIASDTRYGGFYIDQGPASWLPLLGRVSLRRYDMVIVAPATSNTVAKIVHGIADTLVTALVSQALKSNTLVIILPSDYAEVSITELPCRIDVNHCIKCYNCLSENFCYYNAIEISGGYPMINYTKCHGCGKCMLKCPYGAIKCWETISLRPSQEDLNNTLRLQKIRGILVVTSTAEIIKKIKHFL